MNLLHLQHALSGVLSPVSGLYSLLMAGRRRLWESSALKRLNPTCLCVSVGNISWGGTGKTPLVDWLMRDAIETGRRPVVLTRGYNARVSTPPTYVNPRHSPRDVGDEALMLAQNNPEGAVLVDPNRRRAGEYALKALNPDLLLLDDGFQHLSVRRHLEMVLLRPDDLLTQWNKVIPGGSWREGPSALRRADIFCIKAEPEVFARLVPAMQARLRQFEKPVYSFTLQPTSLRRIDKSGRATPMDFGGRPYALVTGVGHPEQVLATVTRYMGYAPDTHLIYPDHRAYDFRDIRKLELLGIPIVCTPKDEVKLRRMPVDQLWCLRVAVHFGPALWTREPFPVWWERWQPEAESALSMTRFDKPSMGFAPDVPWLEAVAPRRKQSPEAEALAEEIRRQAEEARSAAESETILETISTPDGAPDTTADDFTQAPENTQDEAAHDEAASPAMPPRPCLAAQPENTARDADDSRPRPPRPRVPGLPGGQEPL